MIGLGFIILIVAIDRQATVEQVIHEQVVQQAPLTLYQRAQETVAHFESKPKTVCGIYVSRIVGIREYYGVACIENKMFNIVQGRRGYEDLEMAFIDSLHGQYRLKFE